MDKYIYVYKNECLRVFSIKSSRIFDCFARKSYIYFRTRVKYVSDRFQIDNISNFLRALFTLFSEPTPCLYALLKVSEYSCHPLTHYWKSMKTKYSVFITH